MQRYVGGAERRAAQGGAVRQLLLRAEFEPGDKGEVEGWCVYYCAHDEEAPTGNSMFRDWAEGHPSRKREEKA
jgi:hypothetical protein